MSLALRRTHIEFVRSTRLISLQACRYKSTTSAIRAGLRAERPTNGRDDRKRSFGRDDRGSTSSSTPRSNTSPGFTSARGSYSSRSSPPDSRQDNRSLGTRSRFGQDRYQSRDRQDDTGSNKYQRSASGSYRERNAAFGARREARADTRSQPTYGSSSKVSSNDRFASREDSFRRRRPDDETETPQLSARKERRAKFWAEHAPKEDAEDDVPAARVDRRQNIRSIDPDDLVPAAIPYTTASSQFVYGAHSVMAALRSKRRKIYQLIMHKKSEAENIAQIRREASAMDIKITRTADLSLLDTLSEGRPHNGVVLETSGIPARPVLALQKWNAQAGMYKLELQSQSAEEEAVNGTDIKMRYSLPHNPFVVFVDGVTDPGNLGNIIRTAHFFGADAVAVAIQTCASLSSAVLMKASAGACEAIPIFACKHASGFIYNSRQNGWTICAAVAPADLETDPQKATRQHLTTRDLIQQSSLAGKPCILMLGAEGEGLRENLTKKADVFLTIAQASSKSTDVGVESLNVSTAAGVLIDSFSLGVFPADKAPKKDKTAKSKHKDSAEVASEPGNGVVASEVVEGSVDKEDSMPEMHQVTNADSDTSSAVSEHKLTKEEPMFDLSESKTG